MAIDREVLRQLRLFAGMSEELLARLAQIGIRRTYAPGDQVVREGEPGRALFVVLGGRVEVVKGREAMPLGTRGPGEVIGEMALIEDRPRSATVRATEPSVLVEFPEGEMQALWQAEPTLMAQIIRLLVRRLRESDQTMIADLQRKNEELRRAYDALRAAQAELVEKGRMERELQLARNLQQSILPAEFPPIAGYQACGHSAPAREVGGDFYDVISLRGGRVGLVMADVSDKGMAAALYMMLAHSLIRAESRRSASPRQVLRRVNNLLLETSRANMFVSVFYAVLDSASGLLTYARAGHDYPLLATREGAITPLTGGGTVLGMLEGIDVEERTAIMCPGDTLWLYTDGVTDALTESGEAFGRERLVAAVAGVEQGSAEEACAWLLRTVRAWQDRAAQYDDMSALVVRRTRGTG